MALPCNLQSMVKLMCIQKFGAAFAFCGVGVLALVTHLHMDVCVVILNAY